ncbi:peroxisomal carnitine O-octanoyltransferase [Nephila pilipes]|uniref:Peroxisomal carnitine O-octanoyltransferase n=1 Tax=Nephila pilipes TaxID=299642 RepID=A0A8X6QG96_NEPPI|nr:peroxisomal carnitine O-octanoyltransferase [Nephila pilipes]
MSARTQIPAKQNNPSRTVAFPARDALYLSSSEKTFANDELLPSLPVPPLNQTISKYLDSVKSHVTEEEFMRTEEIAQNFQNGIGEDLHAKLLQKATSERNWLEKWWENIAYLSQRTPLIPLCSMSGFTNMGNVWAPTAGSQMERAALYMHFQLQFWKILRKEQLKPHNSHNVPWSMHQFRRYFNTVRIPGESIDRLECFFHTELEEPMSPTHLVILHGGHIFTFDAVDEYGDILTPPELQLQFQRIQDWCNENSPGASVGALTLADRSTWAKNREWLLKLNPENKLHMETIDTALGIVVLDDAEPTDLTGICTQTLAGDALNRWADKSISSIVFKNGTFGLISDHTPFDGLVPVVVNHFVYSSLTECGGIWRGNKNVGRDLLPPRRLDFHIDDHIKIAIEDSKRMYQTTVADCDITVGCFTEYGKAFLKQHNFHPETYAQFALQLAYYTMHGRPAPTYVTAATRQFYHGRTETMRSCFPEVIQWAHAMIEDKISSNEKLRLMQAAANKFKSLMKDCSENKGCDRHLLGLYMMAIDEGMEVPQLFLDSSWSKSGGSGNFILSTSCVGFTPLGGCVMPMKENGYGSFYNIEDNRFTFTVSAFNRCPETNAAKFFQHIELSLKNMKHLLVSAKL